MLPDHAAASQKSFRINALRLTANHPGKLISTLRNRSAIGLVAMAWRAVDVDRAPSRYRIIVVKWVSITTVGFIIVMSKLEAFTSFEVGVPFVTSAVAEEAL
jgi:hypothetical protein